MSAVPELPFAAPIRAIDGVEVSEADGGLALHAWKQVDPAEPYLPGHFPGFTVFPGVFVVESVRQAVAAALGERDGVFPDLVAVRSVRFLAPLLAGDTLTVDAFVPPRDGDTPFAVEATGRRGDGTIACKLSVELAYGAPA
jgi:3-hydroxyacyl-[acyl-carrier-protein] dehydratase